ncbi:M23 family metallopeptidase [Flavilitoribacter nigricans]|uniref:Peptidase M23 n=1 Tax=Flavilitoribacter nigricans (strain ATCC 23147 / DSM 23189 / NBRC 102662 / NCIMB 1420 / SS-2) TaxID=1122177 RepID=A0A2D0N8Z3_FLAN2|nr:M23 family metallopeptidase [Flavilitoribacter nigricans]PHN04619.1 peptidase M23 [Flavilitoribacter nigricans DSM 23189 = NBRC 102662]
MRREKFTYNTQTLRYEKVVEPLSVTVLRIFGFFCAAVLTGFVFMVLAHRYFPSPNEKSLQREVEQLQAELELAGENFDVLSNVLNKIQERDAYAHRMLFGMDPIDQAVWEGGIGGHDKYKDYRQFRNAGDDIIALKEKVDKLKLQMDLQSKSLDTIVNNAKSKEEMLASMPSIKPVRSDKLARELKLLSGFGYRIHPVYKVPKMHAGIDFTAPRGTPIQSTGNGKVVQAGYGSGYGKRVVIDHGYGYKTLYGHMDRIDVKVGDEVKRGQAIGIVGSTGVSTAPHCHYEVVYKGQKIDPIQFVTDGLTPEEYQQLVEAASAENQSLH